MDINHSAILRGWIQGVSWDTLTELYLHDTEQTTVIRLVRELRKNLSLKAQRLDMAQHASFWQQERHYGKDWTKTALDSFQTLQSLTDPAPQLKHACQLWLSTAVAAKLASMDIHCLQDLIHYINTHGENWWQTIPRLGKHSAQQIINFIESQQQLLGIKLNLTGGAASVPVQTAICDVVPLERFAPPENLSGAAGKNRADISRCKIDAENDYQALLAWLLMWHEESHTYRAYRKEAERFLLWAVLVAGKPLSSLSTPDCANYRHFLSDPQPAERWIGKPAKRWTSAWRPFKGALKASSIQQAEVILSSLCEWLVNQRYLDSNPFSGLSSQSFPVKNPTTDRALSQAMWQQINQFVARRTVDSTQTVSQLLAYRRIQFILTFAYHTGLRLHEMTNAKIGDLRTVSTANGEQWWLDVVGKRQKYREVPIPPKLMTALNAHLHDRGLRPVGYSVSTTAIIGKLRGEPREALSASALYQTLKAFFKEAAEDLASTDSIAAQRLLKVSTHWLRHTHGSHAVANGVPLAMVRDNMGHSNIATTSLYVHTDSDARYQAMVQFSSG